MEKMRKKESVSKDEKLYNLASKLDKLENRRKALGVTHVHFENMHELETSALSWIFKDKDKAELSTNRSSSKQ
jgi:hypothetical protein